MQESKTILRRKTAENTSGKLGKSNILFFFISIYFIIFQQMPSYSQQDSLGSYLEIAARNNPVVLQKFTDYQLALQKVPQAGSLSDPELSLGVFLRPMELVSGNQVADVTLMQMFPWFGILKYSKDEMSLMANAKFELFREAKLQVFYELQSTWYELYKVQKAITISEKNVEILKTIERLALVRFGASKAGSSGTITSNPASPDVLSQNGGGTSKEMQSMLPDQNIPGLAAKAQNSSQMPSGSMEASVNGSSLTDLYSIQIEAGDLENSIVSLKNKKKVIIARLNSYLNRPLSSPVYIPETIVADSLWFPNSSVQDSIMKRNPMLLMLEFEKKSFEARKKMVSRMGYPMVGLGLNYSLISKSNSGMATDGMNGTDMIMPMVTVTLPIYRKKYYAISSEAELLKSGTLYNYQATANSLQTEYYEAVQLYEDAHRRIYLYDNQFRLASRSFDLTLKSFSVSSSGLTEVLRLRQQILDYELKQIEAVADFNISIALLKKLMAYSQNE